eukprot:TRINITY_DN10905_c0_g1_i1.p1 TRINITY_DN10905_c0_g1~~TRINITY_DN10905_c0_g1_i1.p1  ORF type:complete len:1152 (+),score=271.19 TRINITY_DN10905_c0_g1_i1:23-3457(+)
MELRAGETLRCPPITTAAFTSRHQSVVVGTGSTAIVFDVVTGAQLARLQIGNSRVTHLVGCAKLSAFAALCENGRISVVREDDYTVAAAFNPTKKEECTPAAAAAASNVKPYIFYAREGKSTVNVLHVLGESAGFKLDEGRKPVVSLACHSTKTLVAAGHADGVIKIYDFGAQVPALKFTIDADSNRGAVLRLDWHPGSDVLVAVYNDGVAVIYQLALDSATSLGTVQPPGTKVVALQFINLTTAIIVTADGSVTSALYTGAAQAPLIPETSARVLNIGRGVTNVAVGKHLASLIPFGVAPKLVHASPRLFPALPVVAPPLGPRLPAVDPGRVMWATADGVFACNLGGATERVASLPYSATAKPSYMAVSPDVTAQLVFYGDGRYTRCAPDTERPMLSEGVDGTFVGTGGQYVVLTPGGAELEMHDNKGGLSNKHPVTPPATRVFRTPLRDGSVVALYTRDTGRVWLSQPGQGADIADAVLRPGEEVTDIVWRTTETPMCAIVTSIRVIITDETLHAKCFAKIPAMGSVFPTSAVWVGETLIYAAAGSLVSLALDGRQTFIASLPSTALAIAAATLSSVILVSTGPVFHKRAIGWLQPMAASSLGREHTVADAQRVLNRWEHRRVTAELIKLLTEKHPAAALTVLLRHPAHRFSLKTRVEAALAAKKPADAAMFIRAVADAEPLKPYGKDLAAVAAPACARANQWTQAKALYELAGNGLAALRCLGEDSQLQDDDIEKWELCEDGLPMEMSEWLGADIFPGAPPPKAVAPTSQTTPGAKVDEFSMDAELQVKQDNRTVDDEGFMEQPDLAAEFKAEPAKKDSNQEALADGETPKEDSDEEAGAARVKIRFEIRKERRQPRKRVLGGLSLNLGGGGLDLPLGESPAPASDSVPTPAEQPAPAAPTFSMARKPSLAAPVSVPQPGVDVPQQCMKQAVASLEKGQFQEAQRLTRDALEALEKEGSKRAGAVRMAVAYDAALRLLIKIKRPHTPVNEQARLGRILTSLALNPAHKATCLSIAARANIEAQNYATAARFYRQIMAAAPPERRAQFEKNALDAEAQGEDRNVPNYTCGGCGASTDLQLPTCSSCSSTVRFDLTTMQVITGSEYVECDVCGGTMAAGEMAAAGSRCTLCRIGKLNKLPIKQ